MRPNRLRNRSKAMARNRAEVVVFDTEFTAWAGSMHRRWSGPGEHKEIVQIGAVVLDAASLEERRAYSVLIRPVRNPVLSDYFVTLTRITNERLTREGTDFATGLAAFVEVIADRSAPLLWPRRSHHRRQRGTPAAAASVAEPLSYKSEVLAP
jgi:inhibitor of KinA sporulation pathway (predicted exonuclease)